MTLLFIELALATERHPSMFLLSSNREIGVFIFSFTFPRDYVESKKITRNTKQIKIYLKCRGTNDAHINTIIYEKEVISKVF